MSLTCQPLSPLAVHSDYISQVIIEQEEDFLLIRVTILISAAKRNNLVSFRDIVCPVPKTSSQLFGVFGVSQENIIVPIPQDRIEEVFPLIHSEKCVMDVVLVSL